MLFEHEKIAPVSRVIESSIDFDHEIEMRAFMIREPVQANFKSKEPVHILDD